MKVAQSDLIHLFSPSGTGAKASADSAEQEPTVAVVPDAVRSDEKPDDSGNPTMQTGASESLPTMEVPTAPPATRETETQFTPLHREVAGALPALWAKAKKQNLSRAEERKKLRTLIVWLAGKKGLQAQELAPMRYRHEGQTVDGKIDLLVKDAAGKALLAVEADWAFQEASLAKLKAAHERGIPVLWVLGTTAKTRQDAKEARKFAMRALGREAGGWIVIFHLEHGWL
jgi:hypothetical protein